MHIAVRDFYAIFESRAPGKYVLHFSINGREGMVAEKSLAQAGLSTMPPEGGNFLPYTNLTFQRMVATLVPCGSSSPTTARRLEAS